MGYGLTGYGDRDDDEEIDVQESGPLANSSNRGLGGPTGNHPDSRRKSRAV
jgi:hypothetical protein